MLRVIVVFCVLVSALPAWAANRYALVIGNDTYLDVPVLQKARNDARSVSEALTARGYQATTLIDAKRREMNQAISRFTGQLQPGDTAVVFFAGHGVEIDGENFLLPTDVLAPTSGDANLVRSESIALSRLLDQIRATGARTTLAIIDACRENPFNASTGRNIGGARGLARVAAPEGTFVLFSAGAGQLALDRLSDQDDNPNSVFTRALLPRLAQPGLELRELVSGLRKEVRALALTSNHQQFPAYYDELLGQFYLHPAALPADVAPQPAPQPSRDTSASDTMRADFDLAREIGSEAALKAFIDRYGHHSDDFTVQVAKEMLAALGPAPSPAPTPTPTPAPEPEEAPAVDARALMRSTQEELNRLGCAAGTADGIAGRNTRAAFDRFRRERPAAGLSPQDLGSERALAALRSEGTRVCPETVAAAPRNLPAETASPSAPASSGYDLTGVWSFRAKCPLLIRSNGQSRFQRSGDGYVGSFADNLGGSGRLFAKVVGNKVTGHTTVPPSPDIIDRWSGSISLDGKTLTYNTAWGCRVTAQRR